MGVCLAVKQTKQEDLLHKSKLSLPQNLPLKVLKNELLYKLSLNEEHYFTIFVK